ncbi:PKD domain-containing protein [Mucilaginibacter paludis]|uniref:PKD domain containing protein n=1 Tax=Mucilaginibacter paludis DSM 18603 TaxID=714943 RepID=H1YFL8_9SPHI|nr:PKD domain-containing protein [Mucilaginibacter paludis]EHQ24420.1 PKD domain containing protein [Mucilaginibacter paludis DSM 18603]
MYKLTVVFVIVFFKLFTFTPACAQTINVNGIDAGTFGQGSTISVKINVDNTSGCIAQSNVFRLYLSDATGNFASEKLIGSFTGFYATFVNGIIPVGTAAGSNYMVRVKSTAPAVVSAPSQPITISASAGVAAGVASQTINSTYPEVFGSCSGTDNTTYGFTDRSTGGSTVSAVFYNELAKAKEDSLTLSPSVNFSAKAANYTITVKAVNNGIVGTKSYTLINNVINSNFGTTGSNTICLSASSNEGLSYNVDVTTANGIQRNFPGLTYGVKWGDGSTSSLTLCDIMAAGGKLSHIYVKSSCGNVTNAQNNVFEIDLQPTSVYCGNVGTRVTSYAKVLNPATNKFNNPAIGCTGSNITFNNTSYPGQDPNATGTDCSYLNAQYTWIADGVQYPNYSLSQPFVHAFATNGTHHVTLRLQNNNGLCPAADLTQDICIQNPPKPAFTVPASVCLEGGAVTPVNTSVTDAACSLPATYTWTVTGPAAVTYAGGTTANSAQPQFVFSKTGSYQVKLAINSASCGVITSPVQTIVVNSAPTATLSADLPLCGNNQVLTFNTDPGPTQISYSGTTDQSATFLWVVTSAGGSAPASFVNGTSASSQYPQILFPDYGTYTVALTYTNTCGADTKKQNITFQQAPTVNAVVQQPICPGSSVTIAGSVTNGSYKSLQWKGGTGTFAPDRTSSLTPVYTPSAAEIAAGTVTLTLDVTTDLLGQCSDIQKNVTINIYPVNTINSAATKAICTGSPLGYQITSNVPASTFTWTAQLTSGNATGFTTSGTDATINDVIVDNDADNNAVITYTIVPHNNGCDGSPFTLTVTVSPVPVIKGAVDQVICSNQQSNIILSSNVAGKSYTWTSTTTGSVSGNSNQVTPIAASSIQDVLVNNSNAVATVTYTITPIGNCAGQPVDVKITVQPLPVPSVPGADAEVCNTSTYTLKGNDPSPGTGKWTLDSGQSGVTFSDDTRPDATVSGLIPGNSYKFRWTITNASTCAPTTNVMTLTIDNNTVAGTTSGTTTTCAGSNSGVVNLTGQSGNVLRWEASVDNGVSWQMVNNTTSSLSYLNLTQTTQYRAVIQSGVCAIIPSSVTVITVNQPAVAANAGPDQILCNLASATLKGNAPAPFTGSWKQTEGPVVNIALPDNNETQIGGLTGGNVYKFVWIIKGLAPCIDNQDEVVITDLVDVTPSFTADKSNGCGTYAVSFTNTSNLLTGSFLWDFGDGSQSSAVSPSHTFQSRTDGKDTTYTVSLTAVNNCAVRPPFTYQVVVRPAAPVVSILPDKLSGCAPFAISVKNTSPGNNKSYVFYLYDGTRLVQQILLNDKTTAVFDPVSPTTTKTYTVYMVATDFCGTTAETRHIPLTISPSSITPQMFIQDNVSKGCAPLLVTLVNNTNGGTSFTYNIYDANNKIIDRRSAGTADLPYAFNTPGTYYVTITATDNCSVVESAPANRIDVFQAPIAQFTADVTSGCSLVTVNFTNQTTGISAGDELAYQYDWDFGDGSPHSLVANPLPHTYQYQNQAYTVTLTATNTVTGCSNTIVKANYITVTSPPVTAFAIRPDTVINIPDYRFSFIDQTSGNPTQWYWSFGDGKTSTSKNTEHTYADTGRYKVTLTTTNSQGCASSAVHDVRITGVPGQLYMPNAFMPSSLNTELRSFKAIGSGMKSWSMKIFNTWGELVWQTSRLGPNGTPAEGWDGTFKGSPAQQGVYLWQATATFINGTEWKGMSYNNSLPKRTGSVNLIR